MAAFSTTDEAVLTAPLELNPLAQSATASSSVAPSTTFRHPLDRIKDPQWTLPTSSAAIPRRGAHRFCSRILGSQEEVRTLYAADASSSNGASSSASTSPPNKGVPELYILADTSYGGCCVDEVAAKHVDADLMVHYGHACLSATARLPVIYVFTKQPLADVSAAARSLADQASS